MDLPRFVEKWSPSAAAEHSNAQSFLNDLCDVLAVERPHPAVGDPKRDRYVFEKPVTLPKEDGATVGHVDLYEVDVATLDAYGWPHDLTDEQLLERLVALNAQRAKEEARGLVRWLRPEFQNPEGARQTGRGYALQGVAGAAGRQRR